jgi:hypothetical protein
MNTQGEKLTVREKIGYAAGDTASNLYFQTFLLSSPSSTPTWWGCPRRR